MAYTDSGFDDGRAIFTHDYFKQLCDDIQIGDVVGLYEDVDYKGGHARMRVMYIVEKKYPYCVFLRAIRNKDRIRCVPYATIFVKERPGDKTNYINF